MEYSGVQLPGRVQTYFSPNQNDMFIDFKITTWERVQVPNECKAEVLEGIKDGTITSTNDIFYVAEKLKPPLDVDWRYLDNSSEYMALEENDQQCTVQAIEDESGKELLLFDNSHQDVFSKDIPDSLTKEQQELINAHKEFTEQFKIDSAGCVYAVCSDGLVRITKN